MDLLETPEQLGDERASDTRATNAYRRGARAAALGVAVVAAAALPLVGLASLLLRKQLDPHFENYQAHFVVFGVRPRRHGW
jgi:hypothetical protein